MLGSRGWGGDKQLFNPISPLLFYSNIKRLLNVINRCVTFEENQIYLNLKKSQYQSALKVHSKIEEKNISNMHSVPHKPTHTHTKCQAAHKHTQHQSLHKANLHNKFMWLT